MAQPMGQPRDLLGEFATIVTGSTRVSPLRTIWIGYDFKFPTLRGAVEDLK